MNRGIKILIAVATVAGLASFAGGRSKSDGSRFREVKVEVGEMHASVFTTGVVQPDNRVDVKAPIAGRAEEVLVQEGDRVERGQILLWMSSSERAALLDAARARGPAELKRWEGLFRPTPLIAPVSGQIIQRNIEPGQSFGTADAILVMADRLIIEAPVDETDISQIKLGQKTTVVLDAYRDQTLPSHVGSIAYEARLNNNVTTYMANVVFDKVHEFIRAGMTANVNFDLASKKDALILPSEALKSRRNETYVLVPDIEGKPVKRTVRVGITDGRRVEILEGVKAGEVVLVELPVRVDERNESARGLGTGLSVAE